MKIGELPKLTVGVIIAILIVSVVAIPIIEDSTMVIRTEENNSTPLYSVVEKNSRQVVEISSLENGSYMIGNKEYTPTQGTFIITDTVMSRIAPDGTFTVYNPVDGSQTKFDSSNNLLTFDNGICKYKKSTGESVETAYTILYIPDVNGDVGLYFGTGGLPLYLDNGNDVYIVSNPLNKVFFAGNLSKDGTWTYVIQPKVFNQTMNGTITDYTGTLNLAIDMSGADDAPAGTWKLNKTAIVATPEDESSTPLFFIVPLKYHVISDDDAAIINIIEIIPILLIVSLLIAIVGTAFTNRN